MFYSIIDCKDRINFKNKHIILIFQLDFSEKVNLLKPLIYLVFALEIWEKQEDDSSFLLE